MYSYRSKLAATLIVVLATLVLSPYVLCWVPSSKVYQQQRQYQRDGTDGCVITTTIVNKASNNDNDNNNNNDYDDYDAKKNSILINPVTTTVTSTGKNRRNVLNDLVISAAASALVVGTATVSAVATCPIIANAAAEVVSGTSTNNVDYKNYTPEKDSLTGKVIVITGGSTGLGLESAKRLAYGGATVIITSRSETKGMTAVTAIQEYLKSKDINNENIYTVQLDLDNLDNVREFPQRLQKVIGSDTKINVLLNNAGVMAIPTREITIDGYERTFQSNHLGHFLLTNKLLPMLTESNGRIINVSSEAHKIPGQQGLQLDNLNGEKQYGPWISYGQSKLANVLFTRELQDRANDAGKSLTAVTLHPGAVQTDLGRYIVGVDKFEQMKSNPSSASLVDKVLLNVLSKFVLTVQEGASTQVYLASSSDNTLTPGMYYDKCTVQKLEPYATDKTKAKALWEISEELTRSKFQF